MVLTTMAAFAGMRHWPRTCSQVESRKAPVAGGIKRRVSLMHQSKYLETKNWVETCWDVSWCPKILREFCTIFMNICLADKIRSWRSSQRIASLRNLPLGIEPVTLTSCQGAGGRVETRDWERLTMRTRISLRILQITDSATLLKYQY